MTSSLKISAITENEQAEQIGLLVGDILQSYNGMQIEYGSDLHDEIHKCLEQDKNIIELVVKRGFKKITFNVRPGPLGVQFDEIDSIISLGHSAPPQAISAVFDPQDLPLKVTVVNFDIKFSNLVLLLVKIAIAAIPATLILGFIITLILIPLMS